MDPISLGAVAAVGAEAAGGTAAAGGISSVLGSIGLGTTAAGGVVGAIGSLLSGEAGSSMYKYQAGVAKINQQIAKQNADWDRKAGEVEAQEAGMKTRAEVGQTKAVQGASGLDVNSGTNVAVRQSETEIGQQNEAIIRSNAAKRAYGFEVEAVQHEAQSNIDVMGAQQAKTAGQIGAVSSILGGASSVSSKWLQGKSVGLY